MLRQRHRRVSLWDEIVADVVREDAEDGAIASPSTWSSRRKAEIVLRVLRGEDLDSPSREVRIGASSIAGGGPG